MSKLTHLNKPEKDTDYFLNKYFKIVVVIWQKLMHKTT